MLGALIWLCGWILMTAIIWMETKPPRGRSRVKDIAVLSGITFLFWPFLVICLIRIR